MYPAHSRQSSFTRLTRFLALSFLTGLTLLLASAGAAAQETITIRGSNTMLPLNLELAKSYASLHPGVEFDIEGKGSETGVDALMNGVADIAACSRRLTKEELGAYKARKGSAPSEIVVGLDGISVFVHSSNRVGRLTLDELARILKGEISNWSEVGGRDHPIDVYNRNPDSGTRGFVQEELLGGAEFSEHARDVSSSSLLVAGVAGNPRAIGYSRFGYSRGARVLRLAKSEDSLALLPSTESVSSGAYPLARPLYYYVDPAAVEKVEPFIEWTLSPQGQSSLTFVGLSPAPGRRAVAAAEASFGGDRDKLVQLTPDNMREYGMTVAVALSAGRRPTQRQVTVVFASSPAILAVSEVSLQMGEYAEVPLLLGKDLTLQFTLNEPMIGSANLRLTGDAGSDQSRTYMLHLADFCSLD